eukprot:bmy_07885T0
MHHSTRRKLTVKPINGEDKETQELVLKLVKETLMKICRLNCYTDKIKSVFFISCDKRMETNLN